MIWAGIWQAVPAGLKWALTGALGGALLFGAGYVAGTREANQRAALHDAEDHIGTRGLIDGAIDNPGRCAWHDRIMFACGK